MTLRDTQHYIVQSPTSVYHDLKANRKPILLVLILVILYVLVSSAAYQWAENIDLGNAVYFTAINVTTVGFGDITPSSAVGKVLAVVNSTVGLVLFGFLVATMTAALQPAGAHQQYGAPPNGWGSLGVVGSPAASKTAAPGHGSERVDNAERTFDSDYVDPYAYWHEPEVFERTYILDKNGIRVQVEVRVWMSRAADG